LPRRETFAAFIVERAGWKALRPCMDFLLLWSFATSGGVDLLGVSEVQKYAEDTHWGSSAKFYRYLQLWREATGVETPGVVLLRVKLARERKAAVRQAMSLTLSDVGVA